MTLRQSMGSLIQRVRRMIGDTDTPAEFDDDEIQAALDAYRTTVRYEPLRGEATLVPNGIIQYRDFYSDFEDWETDWQLVDGTFTDVTAQATAEEQNGHWSFSDGHFPVVYIVGKNYDRYGAAADLLEDWAAKLARDYDFKASDIQYSRSQQAEGLLGMAAKFRRKQRPTMATQVRSDVGGHAPLTVSTLLGPHN